LSNHWKLCASHFDDRKFQRRDCRCTYWCKFQYKCSTARWIVPECLVQLCCGSWWQLLSKWLRVRRAVYGDCVWIGGSDTEGRAEFCFVRLGVVDLEYGIGLACGWRRYDYAMIPRNACLMIWQIQVVIYISNVFLLNLLLPTVLAARYEIVQRRGLGVKILELSSDMVIAGEEVRHVTWLHRIEQAEILSELTDDRHNVLVYVSYLRRVDLRSTGFSLTNATSSSSSLMRTPSSTGSSLIRISLSVRWSLAWSFSLTSCLTCGFCSKPSSFSASFLILSSASSSPLTTSQSRGRRSRYLSASREKLELARRIQTYDAGAYLEICTQNEKSRKGFLRHKHNRLSSNVGAVEVEVRRDCHTSA
jgi:hypothetical protein